MAKQEAKDNADVANMSWWSFLEGPPQQSSDDWDNGTEAQALAPAIAAVASDGSQELWGDSSSFVHETLAVAAQGEDVHPGKPEKERP